MTDDLQDNLKLTYGKANLTAHGFGVLIILGLFAVVGSNIYSGFRIEKLLEHQANIQARDHRMIGQGQEQATCILAMTVEERIKFRDDRRPDAWYQWCWWITQRGINFDK